MRIRPFAAWHPAPDAAVRVASVAYDVVDRTEARRMAQDNPDHFLHVTRPDIDFPDAEPDGSSRMLAHARQSLEGLVRRGVLVHDRSPVCYLYRQEMDGHVQTGVVAGVETCDYRHGVILRHEKTRSDKEDDRLRHTLALRAHAGPVFLMFRDNAGMADRIQGATQEAPLLDFTAPDRVRHVVWRLSETDTQAFCQAFLSIPVAYIADGHHRAAAACRAAEQVDGEEAGRFLAVLFPASQLQVLPYNRCIRDLRGMPVRDFLQQVGAIFRLSESGFPPDRIPPGQAYMYVDHRWYQLMWARPPSAVDPVRALDVSVLQDRLLAPVLGIGDPRTDQRIAFVGGIRGPAELQRRVDAGDEAVAFALSAVTVEDVMSVADGGECMPPKSTWFEPKLRSGLLVHAMDDSLAELAGASNATV